MLHISENAARLIGKMTVKNGIPGGGLRIGIKAGGCSGLSYTFAWEASRWEEVLVL
jgi:iron-sulfur cluster assembly protein